MESRIFEIIDKLRNENHVRPTADSIFKQLKKLDNTVIYDMVKETLNNMKENGQIKVKGEGNSESIFILKTIEKNQTD